MGRAGGGAGTGRLAARSTIFERKVPRKNAHIGRVIYEII